MSNALNCAFYTSYHLTRDRLKHRSLVLVLTYESTLYIYFFICSQVCFCQLSYSVAFSLDCVFDWYLSDIIVCSSLWNIALCFRSSCPCLWLICHKHLPFYVNALMANFGKPWLTYQVDNQFYVTVKPDNEKTSWLCWTCFVVQAWGIHDSGWTEFEINCIMNLKVAVAKVILQMPHPWKHIWNGTCCRLLIHSGYKSYTFDSPVQSHEKVWASQAIAIIFIYKSIK